MINSGKPDHFNVSPSQEVNVLKSNERHVAETFRDPFQRGHNKTHHGNYSQSSTCPCVPSQEFKQSELKKVPEIKIFFSYFMSEVKKGNFDGDKSNSWIKKDPTFPSWWGSDSQRKTIILRRNTSAKTRKHGRNERSGANRGDMYK